MGSLETTNTFSFEMEAKRNCIERAKKILWTEDVSPGSGLGADNKSSKAYIQGLVNLYDELRDSISKSVDARSPSSTSSSELIYSAFHNLNGPIDGEQINTETLREVVKVESNLYRAMWLNCLILLSIVNASNNTKQGSRKRIRKEMNNQASCRENKNILLHRNIDQCRLLVGLLEQLGAEAGSDAHGPWEERIRKWTEDVDNDEDDDHSLNILSFTKEQLEQEEQELLQMAETPIPTSHAHKVEDATHVHANNKRHCSEKSMEAREEIQKLWSADAVVAAQNKARELFVRAKSERGSEE